MTSDWTVSHRWLIRWVALALPIAVGAVLGVFRASMDSSTAAMVLVLAVVVASATGDRITGVLAALSAALSFDFFLTVPYGSLTIHNSEDLELAVVLVLVGLAVTEIALWGRRQQAAALRREGYLQGLADLLALGPHTSADAHSRAIATAITHALGADRTEWVTGQPGGNDCVVDADGEVFAAGRLLPVQRVGLPTDSYTAVPVRSGGALVGYFRVVTSTRVVRPTTEQLRVAVLLADRMAGLYDRIGPTGPPAGSPGGWPTGSSTPG